jgi:hypothetical protein
MTGSGAAVRGMEISVWVRIYRALGLGMPRAFAAAVIATLFAAVWQLGGTTPEVLWLTVVLCGVLGLVGLTWRLQHSYPLWPPEDVDRRAPKRRSRPRRDG